MRFSLPNEVMLPVEIFQEFSPINTALAVYLAQYTYNSNLIEAKDTKSMPHLYVSGQFAKGYGQKVSLL